MLVWPSQERSCGKARGCETPEAVLWLRTRDWHILTAGLLTYTADARFRVKHHSEVSEWTLEIKYLQHKDDGTYHCQVTFLLTQYGVYK